MYLKNPYNPIEGVFLSRRGLYLPDPIAQDGFGFVAYENWSVAQRWDAGQLSDWNSEDLSDYKITKVSFLLNDDGFNSIYVKIWPRILGVTVGQYDCNQLYIQVQSGKAYCWGSVNISI